LTIVANNPSIAAKSARSAFKVPPPLREAGVWTSMASAKVFSSLQWTRVPRLRHSPEWGRADAKAVEDPVP
jgi:hypothetical protein